MKEYHKVKVYHAPKKDEAKDGAIHVKKYGRNDPCPCGSGLKVKNCCGKTKSYFIIKKQQNNDNPA